MNSEGLTQRTFGKREVELQRDEGGITLHWIRIKVLIYLPACEPLLGSSGSSEESDSSGSNLEGKKEVKRGKKHRLKAPSQVSILFPCRDFTPLSFSCLFRF